MRSNKATFNIRLRRARNVCLRRKHLIWRLTHGIARLNEELARTEQLQRVLFRGYIAAGTTLYPKPGLEFE